MPGLTGKAGQRMRQALGKVSPGACSFPRLDVRLPASSQGRPNVDLARTRVRPGSQHHAPRLVAADAIPAAGLPHLLHRSGERRFRRVADEQGGRHRSEDLRAGRRHLLHWLFHPGGALQPGAGTVRGAHLDRPHHDHLGSGVGGVRADRRADLVPGAALPARRGGGRVLSRRDPLHHLLVPCPLPRDHRRHLHGGDPSGRPDRLADLGCHPLHGRHSGPRRLAVDLPAGSGARGASRHRLVHLADRPPRACQLAERGRSSAGSSASSPPNAAAPRASHTNWSGA